MMLRNQVEDAASLLVDFDREVGLFMSDNVPKDGAEVIHVFSKLADQPPIRLLCGALMLGGIFGNSDRLVRAAAKMMIAHEAATFAKDQLKSELDRVRPRAASSRDEAKVKRGQHKSKDMQSFPSGHSAGAIAAARAFSREFPDSGVAAIGGAMLVASLQIPRSAHYPSDVAAGFGLGLLAEKLVDLGWNAARMTERSETR